MAYRVELPGLYLDDVVLDAAATRPVLINRDPEPEETEVLVDTSIGLEIVDVGADGVNRSATRVFVNGTLAFEGGGVPELKPGFDGAGSSVVETADTLKVILDPTSVFASLEVVTVRVISETLLSALPLDEIYSFKIQDLTAPLALSARAIGAKRVRVSFDEPLIQVGDGSTGDALVPSRYQLAALNKPAVSIEPISVISVDETTVEVGLDIEMSQRASYQVTVTGVADVFGNLIATPDNVATFVGFVPPNRPINRRFDLFRLLPEINRQQDQTGDLQKFMAVLQDVLELLLSDVDRFSEIFDPDLAPETFLDLMLEDLGNPFAFDLTENQKRRLVSVLVQIYKQKGTAVGIRNAIRFFLAVDVTAIDAFHGTTLVLGESELGVDWELGPSNRFSLYAFDLTVGEALTEQERKHARRIVDFMKPAHTHFVDLHETVGP